MDDLHTGGILQVVYMRDCPVTWSASVHSIRSGSQVYGSFLGELLTSHGDTVDNEQDFSFPEKWSIREDHPHVRGHATGMCPGSQG